VRILSFKYKIISERLTLLTRFKRKIVFGANLIRDIVLCLKMSSERADLTDFTDYDLGVSSKKLKRKKDKT